MRRFKQTQRSTDLLIARFSSSKTIAGTQSHHSFIPIDDGNIEMRRLSNDHHCNIVPIADHADERESISANIPPQTDPKEYQPGRYIACMYDNEWYIGTIVERS